MSDPLGLIGQLGQSPSARAAQTAARVNKVDASQPSQNVTTPQVDFKQMVLNQIKEANDLEREATQAVEDLVSGKRQDVESVMSATRKADMATQMLLQLRNKVMTAYDEVKQIRV